MSAISVASAVKRAVAGLLLVSALHAQSQSVDDGELKVLPATVRLGSQKLRLPGDEGMGLVGTGDLLEMASGVSFGPPRAYLTMRGLRRLSVCVARSSALSSGTGKRQDLTPVLLVTPVLAKV